MLQRKTEVDIRRSDKTLQGGLLVADVIIEQVSTSIPSTHRSEDDVFFFAMHWMHLVSLRAGGAFKWSILEGM